MEIKLSIMEINLVIH